MGVGSGGQGGRRDPLDFFFLGFVFFFSPPPPPENFSADAHALFFTKVFLLLVLIHCTLVRLSF